MARPRQPGLTAARPSRSPVSNCTASGPPNRGHEDPQSHHFGLGPFSYLELAHELQVRNALSRLITSYPPAIATRFGVGRPKVVSVMLPEFYVRVARRFASPAMFRRADAQARRWYESAARRAFRRVQGDIFVGWSGTCLSLLRDARRRGMITVVERGSSHIVEQDRILREEHDRYGLPFVGIPEAAIEQELAEYQEADYITVPSSFVVDSFLRQGVPRERLLLNPYGADLSVFRPERAPHEPFRIIQVGAVSVRKGFADVIDAFRRAALPNAELWFVGGVTPVAAAYIAKHAIPNVVLQGSVPQAALPLYYSQCDVACLGSVEDGFGLVLLQAAACGLPIVSTTNTGGREIVGLDECGFVVPIRSPEKMAEAFTTLYHDRNRARTMGEAAGRRVETYFSWSDYGERALKHYMTVCGGKEAG